MYSQFIPIYPQIETHIYYTYITTCAKYVTPLQYSS